MSVSAASALRSLTVTAPISIGVRHPFPTLFALTHYGAVETNEIAGTAY